MTNHKTLRIEMTKSTLPERVDEAVTQIAKYFLSKEGATYPDIIYKLCEKSLDGAIDSSLNISEKASILIHQFTEAVNQFVKNMDTNPQRTQESFGVVESMLQPYQILQVLQSVKEHINNELDKITETIQKMKDDPEISEQRKKRAFDYVLKINEKSKNN